MCSRWSSNGIARGINQPRDMPRRQTSCPCFSIDSSPSLPAFCLGDPQRSITSFETPFHLQFGFSSEFAQNDTSFDISKIAVIAISRLESC